MKKIIIILILILSSNGMKSQSFVGAWESQSTNEKGEQVKNVIIFSEGYQVLTSYDLKSGKFISTNGGSWKLDGETIIEKVEFDTTNSERVGSEVSFKVHFNDSVMGIVGDDVKWNRIDNGGPGKLAGAWLMYGRKRNGEIQSRDTSRPRKTMKILSGTRFQWIAYNVDTKQFMGTGGGTYSAVDGKYTENIAFFSRDDSRAGQSLKFDYRLKDGDWHHSGLSSKGDPIYEIWSLRN